MDNIEDYEEILLKDKKEDYELKIVKTYEERVTWYMNGQPIMITDNKGPFSCYQVENSGMMSKEDSEILIGGLGFGYSSQQAVNYGKVTTVELLPSVVDFYNKTFPDFPLDIVVDDVCNYLKNTDKTFDYILFQLDFAGFDLGYRYCINTNKQIYTKTFMKMLYNKLNSGGVFVTEGLAEKEKESPIYRIFKSVGFTIEESRMQFCPYDKDEPIEHINHVIWKCTK